MRCCGLKSSRQVRVAVDGEPVGARGDHRVERLRESVRRLLRQAVDQVDVDRAQAVAAAGLDDRERFLDRLHAVHRRLHRRVEILDAQACPVEADRREVRDVAGDIERGSSSIERSRSRRSTKWKWRRSVSTTSRSCAGERKFGVPPPKWSWIDLAVAIEHRRASCDLAVQPREVALGPRPVARDDRGCSRSRSTGSGRTGRARRSTAGAGSGRRCIRGPPRAAPVRRSPARTAARSGTTCNAGRAGRSGAAGRRRKRGFESMAGPCRDRAGPAMTQVNQTVTNSGPSVPLLNWKRHASAVSVSTDSSQQALATPQNFRLRSGPSWNMVQ